MPENTGEAAGDAGQQQGGGGFTSIIWRVVMFYMIYTMIFGNRGAPTGDQPAFMPLYVNETEFVCILMRVAWLYLMKNVYM